jgi:hypothetical protein
VLRTGGIERRPAGWRFFTDPVRQVLGGHALDLGQNLQVALVRKKACRSEKRREEKGREEKRREDKRREKRREEKRREEKRREEREREREKEREREGKISHLEE